MSKNNVQGGQRSHMQQVTYVPRKSSMLLLCLTHAKPKEIIKAVIQKGASHTPATVSFSPCLIKPISQSTTWN